MAVLRPALVLAVLLVFARLASADVDTAEPDVASAAPASAAEEAISTDEEATAPDEKLAEDLTTDDEVVVGKNAVPTYALAPVPPLHTQPAVHYGMGYGGGDYDGDKEPIWLPFGLLDRMRLAPFHMSATTELGSHDASDGTASLTLHAQMSTGCGCNIGIYATLPTSIALTNESRHTQALASGGSIATPMSDPRTQLGTLDVGLFSGTKNRRASWIYRLGTLLPTGSRDPHPWLPSARAGDRVLELPRSAGVRLSTSRIYGWKPFRPGCSFDRAFRIDAGVDVASVLAHPGNPVHVIPRAGLGMMVTMRGRFIASADVALSLDPFVDDRTNLRLGAGVTGRYARADGRRSVIQPAVTLATVRTTEGWSASVLLDLTASISPNDHD